MAFLCGNDSYLENLNLPWSTGGLAGSVHPAFKISSFTVLLSQFFYGIVDLGILYVYAIAFYHNVYFAYAGSREINDLVSYYMLVHVCMYV